MLPPELPGGLGKLTAERLCKTPNPHPHWQNASPVAANGNQLPGNGSGFKVLPSAWMHYNIKASGISLPRVTIPHPYPPSCCPCGVKTQKNLLKLSKPSQKIMDLARFLLGKTVPHLGGGTCWSCLANYSLVYSNILSRHHRTPQHLTEVGLGLHFGKHQKACWVKSFQFSLYFKKVKVPVWKQAIQGKARC